MKPGHVYFFKCGAFVKIGFSTDYQQRFLAICASNPHEISIVAVHPGNLSDETRFHNAAKPHRHRFEWFHWHPEVQALAVSGLPFKLKIVRSDAIALQLAIERAGTGDKLATDLGITPHALSQWDRVPPLRVLDVERLTGVPRHELRPDVYPAPQGSEPERAAS